MKKEYKIREGTPEFVSYDLYEDGKRVGGGGLVSDKKGIKCIKQFLKNGKYEEVKSDGIESINQKRSS